MDYQAQGSLRSRTPDEVLRDKFKGLRFCPRGLNHRFLTLVIILTRPMENDGDFRLHLPWLPLSPSSESGFRIGSGRLSVRGENKGLPGEKRTDGFYPGRILLGSFLVGRAFHEILFPRSERAEHYYSP